MDITDFKIRAADRDEIDAYVTLEADCFTGDRICQAEYNRLFSRKNVEVYGLYYQGNLIGSAVVIVKALRKVCRLYNFCLKPQYRGLGLATAMLSGIVAEYASFGLIAMYLEVSKTNSTAYNLYATHGFITFGIYPHYYDDGSDALRMKKILTHRETNKFQKQPIMARLEKLHVVNDTGNL